MTKDADEFEPWIWDDSGQEMNFVAQMRDMREAKGWSQTELAKQLSDRGLKFHQPTVQRIERGERPLKLTEALTIADVLGARFETMLRAASVSMTYSELVEDVRAGALDFVAREAQTIEWRVKRHIDMAKELIHAYEQAVEVTPGAELNNDLIGVAREWIRLNSVLVEDAETMSLTVREAAKKFNQLPRDYPASDYDLGHGNRPVLGDDDYTDFSA